MIFFFWLLAIVQAAIFASTFAWDAPGWLRLFVGVMLVVNVVQAAIAQADS